MKNTTTKVQSIWNLAFLLNLSLFNEVLTAASPLPAGLERKSESRELAAVSVYFPQLCIASAGGNYFSETTNTRAIPSHVALPAHWGGGDMAIKEAGQAAPIFYARFAALRAYLHAAW